MREIATILTILVIASLFWLDRDPEVKTSRALWIPTIFLLIDCSRPVSIWLGLYPSGAGTDIYLEGSPVDRTIGIALLAAALIVLVNRRERAGAFLRKNVAILLFFTFALFSLFWSDFPFITFKHWTKGIGDLAMALMIITEVHPGAALKSIFARTAFVLIPLSLLLSKYYPQLGRITTLSWTTEYCGVTQNKNELGCVCLALGLGVFWCFISAWNGREDASRYRRLLAHAAVLGILIWLFRMMDSMTSTSCIVLTGLVMLFASRSGFRRSAARMHAVTGVIVGLTLIALFFDPGGGLVGTLGRDPTLTGRTNIWHIVLSVAHNPLVGVGYESFWLGTRLAEVRRLANQAINESHNGYIEIYIALGWIGVALLGGIIATGYRKVIAALRADQQTATLSLALFLACVLYSLTEAGFRMDTPTWIFFLLSIMLASQAGSSESQSQRDLDDMGSEKEFEPIPHWAGETRAVFPCDDQLGKIK